MRKLVMPYYFLMNPPEWLYFLFPCVMSIDYRHVTMGIDSVAEKEQI